MSRHLPITHPDYIYLPARNPYAQKIESLTHRIFSDHDSEKYRAGWRERFKVLGFPEDKLTATTPLHVEVGCNGGHVLLKWAEKNPDCLFIGIDWKFKQIFRAGEKAEARGLKNLILLRAHADRIGFMFGPNEVDFLALYFPDPWDKKSQRRNRFVRKERFLELGSIVKPHGTFHIKTDHPGYFEAMEESLQEALAEKPGLWKTLSRSTDKHADHPNPGALESPEVTLFEKIFISRGIKIHELILERQDHFILEPPVKNKLI